jgi:glycerol dehydrogenase
MNAIFCSPNRYTQGVNSTETIGLEMTRLGLSGSVLIVAGRSARRLLEPVWRKSLADCGFDFHILDFAGESTRAEVERIAAAARSSQATIILAAGGGKAIDAARAAATDLALPMVSCPTIASTDAPCSAISIIYTEAGVVEEIRVHPRNPVLVLVDTQVIANAPVRTLIAGMGDALSTVFEARACRASNSPNTRGGASSLAALGIAELCYRTLLADGVEAMRSAKEKTVTPALDRIIEANTLLSGLGFESAGLAAAHSVHNGLTVVPGAHDFLHGEKVAFGVIVQLLLESAAPSLLHEVLGFCSSLGLPITLGQIGSAGLSGDLLAAVAARATSPGESIHNEPFPVTPKMVEDAILSADAAGRAFLASQASTGAG